MNKWTSFVILVSLLFCTPVYAERSLTFGLWTQHYSGDHCEKTNNHLVAFESIDGWAGAWFKNSYGNETGFLGHGWHTKKWELRKDWWIRGNLYAGVLIGYGHEHPVNFGMLSPGAYPTASVGYKRYSLEGGVMPTFWWLSFKVEF
jgi:hypothetical protein